MLTAFCPQIDSTMLAVFKIFTFLFYLFCPLALQYCFSAKRDFACYSLAKVQSALRAVCVSLGMLSLYAYRRKCQQLYYKNIAQKSAADFMQNDEMDIIYIIVYNSWTIYYISMFISILIIVYFYRQIVSIYIAICYTVTICYISITVYYISKNSDKVYRYKDLIWHIRCYDVDNQIIGYLIIGEVMG